MPSVLITGAARGFGRALFEVFAEQGWNLFPLVRNRAAAEKLQSATASPCQPIIADVGCDEVQDEIRTVLKQHSGSLDLLINNAGNLKKDRGLLSTSPEDVERLFRVHCAGVLRCVQAAQPFLAKAEKPVIVNISSRWGSIQRTVDGQGGGIYSYQIAKTAQNMLTACLDHELKPRGIRAFAVHPGKLLTEAAARDADTEPLAAARKLAAWVAQVDHETVCGLHDLMGDAIIPW